MSEPSTAASGRATIVMYHYVRRLSATRFPRLTAFDLDAFHAQLDYIGSHYSPVSLLDLAAAVEGERRLPPRAAALTFDDGYAEHYRHVFPLLRARGIPAAFFPAAASLIDRCVLDVNKIQFIVAAAAPEQVAASIDEAVERGAGQPGLRTVADYRTEGWKPVRFDAPAASYVKYMLQRGLPGDLRARVLDDLFRTLVSTDERAFADELYFTIEQAREMARAGMTIGCHADRHLTLPSLSRDGQAREIDGACRVLGVIGLPASPFVFSYAKGAHNADSIDLLRARGCVLAVTNRPDIATVSRESVFALPRIDANDLPADALAPPNEWTLRA